MCVYVLSKHFLIPQDFSCVILGVYTSVNTLLTSCLITLITMRGKKSYIYIFIYIHTQTHTGQLVQPATGLATTIDSHPHIWQPWDSAKASLHSLLGGLGFPKASRLASCLLVRCSQTGHRLLFCVQLRLHLNRT